MTTTDFMDIGRQSAVTKAAYGSSSLCCCNALSLLYSLPKHRRFLVTSQTHLNHYDESITQQLPRGGIRQGCSLGRSRQQRGMERLWEAHRSPYKRALAHHVPQALEPSPPCFERRSAPQTGAIARSAAACRGKANRGRLPKSKRAFQSESGIERTGAAEASTGPKWVPRRNGSGAQ